VKVPNLNIGDLVARTYGEGQRPVALVVGRFNALIVEVKWLGSDMIENVNSEYLEVISASR